MRLFYGLTEPGCTRKHVVTISTRTILGRKEHERTCSEGQKLLSHSPKLLSHSHSSSSCVGPAQHRVSPRQPRNPHPTAQSPCMLMQLQQVPPTA